MVLVALDHADGAVHVGVGPVRVLGQGLLAVAHAVALDVGLVDQVEAVAVAQVIPGRLVRIMAGAHGVDVVLLHHQDVLDHALDRDRLAAVGIDLVAVDALEEDALAVDEQVAVPDLDLAEADVDRDDLQDRSARVLEREEQLVEVRRLGRPLERIRDRRS